MIGWQCMEDELSRVGEWRSFATRPFERDEARAHVYWRSHGELSLRSVKIGNAPKRRLHFASMRRIDL